jgi:SAM-dependent methyltransferase
MVTLDGIKQSLHDNYPRIYRRVLRFYRMTPRAKHRVAKRAEMENEIRTKVHARSEYESKIIKQYLDDDWTVRHGTFSGMKLGPLSAPRLPVTCVGYEEMHVEHSINDATLLATCVIGCYESQVHSWINDSIAYGYDRILDIGCSYGYYAVGFALKSRNSTIYAYDTDQRARENTAELARLNGVAEKVHVRALCTLDELNRAVSNRTLIFCDIEGGEFDLLRPDLSPVLSRADLIVETHDNCRPGVTETLARRFVPSHQIEIVYHGAKYPVEFPVLKAVPTTEHAWLLQEGRPRDQRWMRLLANRPRAVEPGKPYFLTPSLSL